MTNYQLVNITGVAGRTYTVLSSSISGITTNGAYAMHNDVMYGLNKALTVATGTAFSFPPVFRGTSNRAVGPTSFGDEAFAMWTETFTFSKRTIADNNNHLTVGDVISYYSNYLESRGYVYH
jgi:hypothetical protein